MRPEAEQASRRDRAVRPHRAAPVQPHVPDADRPGRGDGSGRVPAPGDGAGHLHQLQERRPDRAAQAAVRHRADRQGVPERDHAGQLHLPHARVRADGDGVLRPARRRPRSGSATGSRSASRGTCATASGRATSASVRTTPRSSPTTPRPRATSSTSTRSAGRSSRDRAPRRLRPHRAHRGVRDEARVGRRRGALHAARRSSRRSA